MAAPSSKLFAQCANGIYNPDSHWNYEFSRNGIRVGVQKFDEFIMVAARGTLINSLTDLHLDVDAFPVTTPYGYLHRGFWEGMTAFRDEIDEAVAGSGTIPIFGTGHSLGAAMIILWAMERLRRGFPMGLVETFGCPRIAFDPHGTGTMLQNEASRLHLIGEDFIHVDDPVPTWPLGFAHARITTPIPQSQGFTLNRITYHRMAGYEADCPT